jgi:two-component system, OmpR family, sensor histidine kinase BaeS
MTRHWRSAPPPWWPEGEAWPPRHSPHYWRQRRARFVVRAVLLVGAVWVLTAVGAGTFIALVARSPALGPGRAPVLVMVLLVAVAIGLMRAMRGVGSSIGDLVTAAHRVAAGDFGVRVPPKGPPSFRAVAGAFNDMAERLARQERQRRELMADIAHELRTPLSVVSGRLEGMIDGIYPREASQLEPLLDDMRVLARLVEDLRTLANAESGVMTLEREPTDVGMLVRDAVSAVQAEAARLRVTLSIDDDLDHSSELTTTLVNLDPVRIRQVLVNLIGNAIQHGGSGVTVSTRIAGGALVVRVADNGPGIPPGDLPKIFERFYKRAGSSGSGLGLTIARSLVNAHGGTIEAQSGAGSGTAITFRIPV